MEKPDFIAIVDLTVVYEVKLDFFNAIIEHELVTVYEIEGAVCIDSVDIGKLEQIIRLTNELKINLEGVDVILNLLDRIELMKEELIDTKHKLRFLEE
ncbi:MAG: hypothetical protein GQ574_24930 [Crocinitomix sp.]|nr:hypothetical protein [Crocinitomix sp.]